MKRREFIKTGLGVLAAGMLGINKILSLADKLYGKSSSSGMPLRRLGRTGHKVSIFSLGGESAVEKVNSSKAVKIINEAIDKGVNYIDTAPAYGSGGSELNIGRVMKYRRKEVFLASKTDSRSYAGTMKRFKQSLRRLNTDYLDLYQLHNIRTENDLKRVFAPDGAVKALEELKKQGLIRYTGITGHRSPAVLLKGIETYSFDCILLTLNAADIHYKPFQKELLQTALKKDMGIIAMKVTARGRIFKEKGIRSMSEALGYTLSFPVSTAIVGVSNSGELRENIRIAEGFSSFSPSRLKEIEGLTKKYEKDANFFKYYW